MPLDHFEPSQSLQAGAVGGSPERKTCTITWLAVLNHLINFSERLERSEAINRLERLEQSFQRFSIGSNPLLVIAPAASGEARNLISA